jgi:diguanylate cyclase (GGDEF)-like protein
MRAWGDDVAELERSVRVGTRINLSITAGVAVYLLLTLDRAHRPLLLGLDAFAFVFAGMVAVMPLEAMVRRRLAVPFFMAWSASLIALVAIVVAIENDPASPFLVFFFLPILFAAIAYPLRLVLWVAALDVVATVVTLLAFLDYGAADTLLFAVALIGAAGLCVLQARSQEQHLSEVARLSRTDHLTGCLNRRGFEEELDERLARLRRHGAPVGLVLLDLDGFKEVNDQRGHAAGDALLRRVSAAIDETVRAVDSTSRVGGDEFAVLLDHTDPGCAEMVTGRILHAVAAHSPATAGWSVAPLDGDTADALFRIADARLYERKRVGAVAR